MGHVGRLSSSLSGAGGGGGEGEECLLCGVERALSELCEEMM
jgi:hypothetical protein